MAESLNLMHWIKKLQFQSQFRIFLIHLTLRQVGSVSNPSDKIKKITTKVPCAPSNTQYRHIKDSPKKSKRFPGKIKGTSLLKSFAQEVEWIKIKTYNSDFVS